MTEFEVWSLIINGFVAFGTVSAVIIALWATLHQQVRYKIKSIRVSSIIDRDKVEDNALHIMFDNRLPVQMEIHDVELEFTEKKSKSSAHTSWSCNDEFIPALSQYEVKFPLTRGWAKDSLRSREINCITKTSFGDTITKFPDKSKELLCCCLEVQEEATTTKAAVGSILQDG